MSIERLIYSVQIPADFAGYRVDLAASLLLPDLSRTRLRNCILTGELRVNNREVKPAYRLNGNELLEIDAAIEQITQDEAENIVLDLVYQDEHIIVINKPAGLVVHPAAGNLSGTLLNALLFYDANLSILPRAGIVHRLDKDTSGLLVVARSEKARQSLIAQLQDKSMSRIYMALCHGQIKARGVIDKPIARHSTDRKKMAVIPSGKAAKTLYEPVQIYDHCSLIRLELTTGRTHQIRVHMHSIRHPLVGDAVYGYGGRKSTPDCITSFPRQALNATALSLVHPDSGQIMKWQIPLPEDIKQLLAQLDHLS